MRTEPTRDSADEIAEETWRAETGPHAGVPAPRQRWEWRSTAFAGVAIVALVVALVVVYVGPGEGPKVQNIPQVALGFDGIPNQIDGQRVYRLGEQPAWQNLAGSFLLGAWPQYAPTGCHFLPPLDAASDALVGGCSGYELLPLSARRAGSGGARGNSLTPAPRGAGVLRPWDDRLVVVRVHTHDREAAGCSEATRVACDEAVVAEEVVWPIVPMDTEGERVFRAADSETYGTLTRSFLFGGIASGGSLWGFNVDGEQIALRCPGFLARPWSPPWSDGDIVVVRAHVNDPISDRCPDRLAQTIVLDSVDWWYDPYAAPYAIIPPATAQVGPSVGPLGPDGIPLSIDGRHVYSSRTGLPSDAGFLLGGRVARAEPCPTDPPSPNQDGASSSVCGQWFVGDAPVNVLDGISPSLNGKLIVLDVVRTRVLSTCATSSPCGPSDVLVVTSVVWSEPSAQGTPTPGVP